MNKPTVFRLIIGLFVLPVMVLWLALTPRQVQAQAAGSPADFEKFSREELAQMLGPIALYPDKLLSQILMASTYPIEVIEADRWVKRNPDLQGDNLDRALLAKDWDPSVKAVSHFPAILALMSERITETTNLGNAFLVQEAEVMDMIQELRAKAYAQGNLITTEQQQVIVRKETIIIEPANPRVIYVPYYDPFYVYGPWWYPAYPPYYWGPAGVRVGLGFNVSFWPGIYFGFSWGNWSYFDWPRRYVYIHVHERPRYVSHHHWYTTPGRWVHTPVHRRGVAYRDKYTATKYGQYPQRPAAFRGDVRGFPERREAEPERSRSVGESRRIDQKRRVDDNSRHERGRQEQQRVERELQRREPQLRQPVERDRPHRQEQTGVERTPRERQRVEPPRQERTRAERPPQERQRVEQEQQLRQSDNRERPVRDAVEGARSQQRRDNVFSQPDNGRTERQSSERGRSSRHEQSNPSRDRSRGDDSHGGGREGGGRNWR